MLRLVDRFVLGWKYDLQQFAIIGPAENGVANTGWLNPAGTFLHGLDALSLKFTLEPTFEDIHELEFNVVMVPENRSAEIGPETVIAWRARYVPPSISM